MSPLWLPCLLVLSIMHNALSFTPATAVRSHLTSNLHLSYGSGAERRAAVAVSAASASEPVRLALLAFAFKTNSDSNRFHVFGLYIYRG
jgi:hypothetical protein